MIFLIEYNPPEGRIVTFKTYSASDRVQAHKDRLEIELDLHRKGIKHEVVLLEAENEEAIRKTHQRYFMTPVEILEELAKSLNPRET